MLASSYCLLVTIQRLVKLQSTGSKPCPYISSIGLIKVARGVPEQPGSGRPTAAAQDLVVSKPGMRVFLVGIDDEPGIGQEVRAGPLPDIANHLPAAKRAIAFAASSNVHAASGLPVEIGPFRRGGLVTPREPLLARPSSRVLPLGFRGQAPAGPAGAGGGFVPVYVDHRLMGFESDPVIEGAALPAVSGIFP